MPPTMEKSPTVEQGIPSSLAHDLQDLNISRTDDILLSENVDFRSLLLPEETLHGLHAAQFQRPSPIQLRAIPLVRLGFDLIVQAKSGTGKTLVIGLAALETVKISVPRIQVVILAPTREIALQIKDVIIAISSGHQGLNVQAFVGGLSRTEDRKHLIGCHVAIGTPGRFQDLIKNKDMHLKYVRLLILDEADTLMEGNLFDQVKDICKVLPTNKQTILCSATFQNPLQKYVASQMKEPFWVSSEGARRLQGGKLESDVVVPMVLKGVRHFMKEIPQCLNINKLLNLKLEEIISILSNVSFSQCLIFSNYQTVAETICNLLVASGWPAKSIRGQDEQSQRMAAISDLKEFRCRVLLSTDLTSRGIDIKGVDLVINLDIPYNSATYLHRTGRAGRFGSHGSVITLVSQGKEMNAFQNIIEDIPSMVVFRLPENMQINNPDDEAFEKLDFELEKGPCTMIQTHPEDKIITSEGKVDPKQFNALSSGIVDEKTKEKQVLQEAKKHLAATVGKELAERSTFVSYHEFEKMFDDWTVDANCEDKHELPRQNVADYHGCWISAEIVLLQADHELQQLINVNSSAKEPNVQNEETEESKLSDSSYSKFRLDTKYSRKQKKSKVKSKIEVKEENFQTEKAGTSGWKWDEEWNSYYTWDPSSACCYFFNPWTQCYFKWECDVFYKWNEQSQLYEACDPNSNTFFNSSSNLQQNIFNSYSDLYMHHLSSDEQSYQYWQWCLLWKNQLKQMWQYDQYLSYFHSVCNIGK